MARLTSSSAPSALPVGIIGPNDGVQDQFGASYVQPINPTKSALAAQGQYFTAQNATPGTGIAQSAAVTAFSDTTGFFVLQNTSASVNVHLDYLRLILTAATTAVVSTDILVVTDIVSRAPSTGSTGTSLTARNVNSASSTAAALAVTAYNASGAMTIPASGASARRVSRVHVPTGLHVVGDEMLIQWAGVDFAPGTGALSGSSRTTASAPGQFVGKGGPVVLGPGHWAVIHRWSLTEAAAVTFEYELGWWER